MSSPLLDEKPHFGGAFLIKDNMRINYRYIGILCEYGKYIAYNLVPFIPEPDTFYSAS